MSRTCKGWVNEKYKCDYCAEKCNSTSLSKNIERRHSTYSSSITWDG